MEKVTRQQIFDLSSLYGIDPALVYALIMVESSGRGYDLKTGKVLIRFEPKRFALLEHYEIPNIHHSQRDEWDSYNKAALKNKIHAIESTSWGMMQIMGENWRKIGYLSPFIFKENFEASEYYHVAGALEFIKNKPSLYLACKNKDFINIAYFYNGENYKLNAYDERLHKAYNQQVQNLTQNEHE